MSRNRNSTDTGSSDSGDDVLSGARRTGSTARSSAAPLSVSSDSPSRSRRGHSSQHSFTASSSPAIPHARDREERDKVKRSQSRSIVHSSKERKDSTGSTASKSSKESKKSSSATAPPKLADSIATLGRSSTLHLRYKPVHPVVAASSEWLVEEHSKEMQPAQLLSYRHVYALDFYPEPHLNYVLAQQETAGDKKETVAKAIVSVARFPERSNVQRFFATGTSHRVLIQHESGYEETLLHNVPQSSTDEEFASKLEQYLRSNLASKDMALYAPQQGPHFSHQHQKDFQNDLLALEERHSRQVRHMKIAVLYAKPGQTSLEQLWKNKPPAQSPFYTFLDSIATRIDLETWSGYRGDMGTNGLDLKTPAYFTTWKGIDVFFHVAPWMNEEQHRRLCGNDVGVLIYFDVTDKSLLPPLPGGTSSDVVINRVLITDIFKQIILMETPALQAMSKTFYKVFFDKAPEAKDFFDDTIGTSDWRMTESLKKILDFVARVADHDASISVKTFSERRNFYGFLGLDERIFEHFSAALVVALKSAFPETFTTAHSDAWSQHLAELAKLCLGLKEYTPRVAPNFVPFDSVAMGSVPQVFAVVEPHPTGNGTHRLGFFQRPALGPYPPQSPPIGYYFNSDAIVDWLFGKLHNGFLKATLVAPFDRLFIVPRREAIREMAEKYPKAKKKIPKHFDSDLIERSGDLSPSPKSSRNMKLFGNSRDKDKPREAERDRDSSDSNPGGDVVTVDVDADKPLTDSQKRVAELLMNPIQ